MGCCHPDLVVLLPRVRRHVGQFCGAGCDLVNDGPVAEDLRCVPLDEGQEGLATTMACETAGPTWSRVATAGELRSCDRLPWSGDS